MEIAARCLRAVNGGGLGGVGVMTLKLLHSWLSVLLSIDTLRIRTRKRAAGKVNGLKNDDKVLRSFSLVLRQFEASQLMGVRRIVLLAVCVMVESNQHLASLPRRLLKAFKLQ
jgi:hypothetical protein